MRKYLHRIPNLAADRPKYVVLNLVSKAVMNQSKWSHETYKYTYALVHPTNQSNIRKKTNVFPAMKLNNNVSQRPVKFMF